MAQNFKDLRVWQKSMDLWTATLSLAEGRVGEQAEMKALREVTVSIPCLLAEGYQRRDTSGFLEKLTRVQDGLVKAFVLLEMALRRGNGCESAVNRCLQEGDDLGKMVYRLKKALEEGREEGGERGRDKGTASGQQSRSNGPVRA